MVARAVVVIAAVAFVGNAAAARSVFGSNVCGLLSAHQVMVIRNVTSRCINAKPAIGPASTIYVANWAGKSSGSPQLQVTVSRYMDQGALALAKRNLKQGLPGAPKKVAGIGSAAYEANGASASGIHFALGTYVVAVNVTGTGKPSWSDASVEALAKDVAAKLS